MLLSFGGAGGEARRCAVVEALNLGLSGCEMVRRRAGVA